MKTSKTIRESGSLSKDKKEPKGKMGIEKKLSAREEDIREKAKEIYQQRIERGEDGTAEDDWLQAEEFFRTSED